MKKKILGGLAVLAIATVTAFNTNIDMQNKGVSAISLNNVEALGSGEINPNCPNGCWTYYGYCYCYGEHEHYEAIWF